MDGYNEIGKLVLDLWQKPEKQAAEKQAMKEDLEAIGTALGAVLSANLYEKALGR